MVLFTEEEDVSRNCHYEKKSVQNVIFLDKNLRNNKLKNFQIIRIIEFEIKFIMKFGN